MGEGRASVTQPPTLALARIGGTNQQIVTMSPFVLCGPLPLRVPRSRIQNIPDCLLSLPGPTMFTVAGAVATAPRCARRKPDARGGGDAAPATSVAGPRLPLRLSPIQDSGDPRWHIEFSGPTMFPVAGAVATTTP